MLSDRLAINSPSADITQSYTCWEVVAAHPNCFAISCAKNIGFLVIAQDAVAEPLIAIALWNSPKTNNMCMHIFVCVCVLLELFLKYMVASIQTNFSDD